MFKDHCPTLLPWLLLVFYRHTYGCWQVPEPAALITSGRAVLVEQTPPESMAKAYVDLGTDSGQTALK